MDDLTARWAPRRTDFAINDVLGYHQAALQMVAERRQKIIETVRAYGPPPTSGTSLVAPLVDFELMPWDDDGEKPGWLVKGIATPSTPADRRLPRGTRLQPSGFAGDPTVGTDTRIYHVAGSAATGRAIHVGLGHWFGFAGEAGAIQDLLVSADEPALDDPASARAVAAYLPVTRGA